MARIPCPECRKQISETADSCPKCGYKLTPEKVDEIKKKTQTMQIGCAIALIVVFIPILFSISDCSTKAPTRSAQRRKQMQRLPKQSPRDIYEKSFANEISEFNRKYGEVPRMDAIAELKREYTEARKQYGVAKSHYHQNPSTSNEQDWDNATKKLDHAYILLEIAMGAEPYKGVTQQRRALEAFTD